MQIDKHMSEVDTEVLWEHAREISDTRCFRSAIGELNEQIQECIISVAGSPGFVDSPTKQIKIFVIEPVDLEWERDWIKDPSQTRYQIHGIGPAGRRVYAFPLSKLNRLIKSQDEHAETPDDST